MTDKRVRRRNRVLLKLDVAKLCGVTTGECTKALVKSARVAARVEHDFEAKHETKLILSSTVFGYCTRSSSVIFK